MKGTKLSEMYLTMIRNAFEKRSIAELEAIKEVINLTPMKYIMSEELNIAVAENLIEIIDTKIDTIKMMESE